MSVELGPEVTAFRLAFEKACADGVPPTKATLGADTFARIKEEVRVWSFLKHDAPDVPLPNGYAGRLLCDIFVDFDTAERMDFSA